MFSNANNVKKATINQFAQLWRNNFIANSKYLSRKPGVRKFFYKMNNIPAIVVGAGPSLDKNIKYLKQAKDKTAIIACDAALKILLEEDITPSFVVILDPQDFIINFFTGVNTRNITLIAPTIVHPKVIEIWQGDIIFYNKFAPDIPVLVEIEKRANVMGSLTPGGTVLSVAYDFAFKAGCNPIIFVGQDLSYTENSGYAKGGLYNNKTMEQIFNREKNNIVYEKDMFGQTVPTIKSMSVTKTWFEWAFTNFKRNIPLKVINSTEGGILANKCTLMPLAESLFRYCNKKINMKWTISKILKA